MSSVYPGGLDSFDTNRTDATPNATTQAADHNDYADAINQIEATLGVNPQGSFSTVVERLDNGGSQPILMSSKSITAAQLLALHTTPVELLPAPGGRFYYAVHNTIAHYRFVTTPYNETISNELMIGYGDTLAEILSAAGKIVPPVYGVTGDSFFQKTSDWYFFTMLLALAASYNDWSAASIEDQAVGIGLGSGKQLTGGDSTLTIRTFYSLIDGAP